ncbi:NFX1-type zinc finger-containing protein 1 [Periconia macrospinosa]|uniref:NFX1-type zinc finger-containing protein 1 n=1 Tax=Periconia macrospinosa TaxID=97972 RepID=A0A2V1ECP3_9PLEO|nr:NFX1-type zinc finger-containing protein 1 [Periconia macrospinosa]
MDRVGHNRRGRCSRGEFGRGRSDVGSRPCHFFLRHGHCKFGSSCKYSHDLPAHENSPWDHRGRNNGGRPARPEETHEQQQARMDYNAWRRIIKVPPIRTDERTVKQLWGDGLAILNGDNLEWQQMLPRDLDSEEYRGREHIKVLLELRSSPGKEKEFIHIAYAFLSVITHRAFLDCLSVDTSVGALYNFVSGTNGKRAIPYFQHLSQTLVESHLTSANSVVTIQKTLQTMLVALRELLGREPRARFNENITTLLDSIEQATNIIAGDSRDLFMPIALGQIKEIRAIIARANGLLAQADESADVGTVTKSTYPRNLVMPRDRHDNDKPDIVDIKIFPTSEEIMSDAIEFLPSTDLDQPHFLQGKVERHIDTCFRLLRHDTFGELKAALGLLLHTIQNDPTCINNPRLGLGDFRAFHYSEAYISYISFDRRHGLEMNISFRQPPQLRKKSAKERQKWWKDSKRLEEVEHLFFTVSRKNTDTKHDESLTKEDYQCTITLKLVAIDQTQVGLAVSLSCQKTCGVLLEFPGIIPATFVPILDTLKGIQKLGRLPFTDCILPDPIENTRNRMGGNTLDIAAPFYTRCPGFSFNLKSILKIDEVENGDIYVLPTSSADDTAIVETIEARTALDRGQSQALISALTREFALIQGPPGTGKSYLGVELMKILMDCKSRVDLGPIVVVCYTNHALDQFLEHLVNIGIKKTIRIGGQSHSTVLEEHNLRKVSLVEGKTKSEGYLLHKSYEELEDESEKIEMKLVSLHRVFRHTSWSNLKYHLRYRYPKIHRQFSRFDEDGFERVGKPIFDTWLPSNGSDGTATEDDAIRPATTSINQVLQMAEVNVHSLPQQEKKILIEFWSKEIHENALDDLYESIRTTHAANKQLADIHDEVDRRVLQAADVIGITTTGLAKRISTLKRVRCKIVICEEAGEVMEPHMISALLPTVEHLIQIGDHEQLRPQINNYGLSLESKQGSLYQLDRSQFERLSVGQPGRPRMPVAQLNVQRRMRPEISKLIRETIYPRLNDHDITLDLPNVVGMQKNVYWMDHDHFEEGQNSEMHYKSHSNFWEVEMVHALVRHIVRQGVYRSSDIAVLTPYTGQLQKLRSAMRNDFEIVISDRDQEALDKDGFNEGDASPRHEAAELHSAHRKTVLEKKTLNELLRIATVDNFQGEEAKVIVVSLVRSNNGKRVGFLRTTNRINVLLSRAQHGMYLIGNSDTYSNIDMWQKVINMLRMTDAVGTSLGLSCPRHPETEIKVHEPDDFPKVSPEGGCRLACLWRLHECGHMCQSRCHSESMHNVFMCPQSCQRLHEPCGHACQKPTCGESCGKCHIKLNNVPLPCGHFKDNVLCFQAQNPGILPCSILVEKLVPSCKHTVKVACSVDVTGKGYRCSNPCSTTLPCGHLCPGTCSSCHCNDAEGKVATSHQKCTKPCGRRFGTCNHSCQKACHGKNCGPCLSPCEVRCQHSKCTLRCHEPCAPCVERCTWECQHRGRCNMPCSAPCNRLPCDQRCLRNLSCGHQCPGICGEECPTDYCHACGSKADARVDLLEMKTYSEIDINETPISVLGCKHFFTAESLDGLVGMNEVYTTNKFGDFVGLANISGSLATKIPKCPDCQRPIMQYITQRYNRVINRAVIDEMSKRFLVNGTNELRELEKEVEDLESHLGKSRRDIKDSTENIEDFLRSVADRHQPAHKLHEAIVHARRNNKINDLDSLADTLGSLSIHQDGIPPVERDRRVTFGGRILQIKTDCVLLEDKFQIAKKLKSSPSTEDVKLPGGDLKHLTKLFVRACAMLMQDCVAEKLPKLAVEAAIHFATIAQLYRSSGLSGEDRKEATEYAGQAKELLKQAQTLCEEPFQNADQLKKCVEENIAILGREWYEEVTPEELAEIKKAMVSGRGGIATHSGHWYDCANGHPFAIGECGMPMQVARCPECGAAVGGQSHQAVEGVTRATRME